MVAPNEKGGGVDDKNRKRNRLEEGISDPGAHPRKKHKRKEGAKKLDAEKFKLKQWNKINQQCRMRLDCKAAFECFDYHIKLGVKPNSDLLATILSNVQMQPDPSVYFRDAVRVFHIVSQICKIEEPSYVTMIQLLAKIGDEEDFRSARQLLETLKVDHLSKRGAKPLLRVYTPLIRMCARRDNDAALEDSFSLLKEVKDQCFKESFVDQVGQMSLRQEHYMMTVQLIGSRALAKRREFGDLMHDSEDKHISLCALSSQSSSAPKPVACPEADVLKSAQISDSSKASANTTKEGVAAEDLFSSLASLLGGGTIATHSLNGGGGLSESLSQKSESCSAILNLKSMLATISSTIAAAPATSLLSEEEARQLDVNAPKKASIDVMVADSVSGDGSGHSSSSESKTGNPIPLGVGGIEGSSARDGIREGALPSTLSSKDYLNYLHGRLHALLEEMMQIVYRISPELMSTLLQCAKNLNAEPKLVKVDEKGVCPHCKMALQSLNLSSSEQVLLERQIDSLVPSGKRKAFDNFKEWLKEYTQNRMLDVIIDGANVGYYSLRADRGVSLCPQQIDYLLQHYLRQGKKALIFLHERHLHEYFTPNEEDRKLILSWKKDGILFVTPNGFNDDWYWMYAGVYCSKFNPRVFVCTLDQMRDHHWETLQSKHFLKWRERHMATFHLPYLPGIRDRMEQLKYMAFHDPWLYSRRVQGISDVKARSTHASLKVEGDPEDVRVFLWHLPSQRKAALMHEGLSRSVEMSKSVYEKKILDKAIGMIGPAASSQSSENQKLISQRLKRKDKDADKASELDSSDEQEEAIVDPSSSKSVKDETNKNEDEEYETVEHPSDIDWICICLRVSAAAEASVLAASRPESLKFFDDLPEVKRSSLDVLPDGAKKKRGRNKTLR